MADGPFILEAGLGWQLQERSTAEPIALPRSIDNLKAYEFRRVSVMGEFLHKHEFYLFNRSLKGKPGLNVITPLKRADEGGHVLVNRGWVPFEKRHPKTRPKGQIEGSVIIELFASPGSRHLYAGK